MAERTTTEEKDNCQECQEWLFTFGHGHKYPNKFIRLFGSYSEARELMFVLYNDKWAFQYPASKEEELAKYGITEVK